MLPNDRDKSIVNAESKCAQNLYYLGVEKIVASMKTLIYTQEDVRAIVQESLISISLFQEHNRNQRVVNLMGCVHQITKERRVH